ncbi:Yip1 family protein [Schaalia sp. lx-260]|uniref:Yip1 family protein n=1 Tax=Schaalia sp. lx-260 TaxID=2899082 RepID=UPI001E610A4D|nr:Yip1 family protein [Schaalia sp. lx-260]MCD4548830.1 hypothetical protein [Schaalia sp. lx-260]
MSDRQDDVLPHEETPRNGKEEIETTDSAVEQDISAPDLPQTEESGAALSESMWASVRDRDAVLTGEEVSLENSIGDTQDIIGSPAAVVLDSEPVSHQGENTDSVSQRDEPTHTDTFTAQRDQQDTHTSTHAASLAEGAVHEGSSQSMPVSLAADSTPVVSTPDSTSTPDFSEPQASTASEDSPEVHTTTIPVMASPITSVPVERKEISDYSRDLDDVKDVLQRRSPDSGSVPEIHEVEDTLVQRRSLVTPTSPAPDAAEATSWRPRESDSERLVPQTTPENLDNALFEGASLIPEMPSRTGAHWLSLILMFFLAPLTWFFAADAGARMAIDPAGPAVTGNLNLLALGELGISIVFGIVILVLTLRSSLGAWVSGILLILLGTPWVIVPGVVHAHTAGFFAWLSGAHVIGANFVHHVQASGYSGRILLYGLALVIVGFVAHRARRIGRQEEALRAEVALLNPTGAYFTARARRKAAKAAGVR